MALSGKTVDLNYIIERVRDAYEFDVQMYPEDIAEHVFDAMGLIGVAVAYIRKQATIDIVNHRGELPCDLYQKITVKEATSSYSMIVDTSTFRQEEDDSVESDDQSFPVRYNINSNYIFTSFKDGSVIIEYLAFPLDKNGLPLVPDDPRYIKAIISYIAERIAMKLWMKDKLSENKYRHIEREWLFYVKSASNRAKMPDLDKLEAMKNISSRMITASNHHDYQFKYRDRGEQLNIK